MGEMVMQSNDEGKTAPGQKAKGGKQRGRGIRRKVLPVELLVLVVGDVLFVLRPQGPHRVAHLPVHLVEGREVDRRGMSVWMIVAMLLLHRAGQNIERHARGMHPELAFVEKGRERGRNTEKGYV